MLFVFYLNNNKAASLSLSKKQKQNGVYELHKTMKLTVVVQYSHFRYCPAGQMESIKLHRRHCHAKS